MKRPLTDRRVLFFYLAGLAVSVFFGALAALGAETDYAYTIRPGDTLGEIARLFCTDATYKDIARNNHIRRASRISPGQVVVIPATRPVKTLRQYLTAIANRDGGTAYALLADSTRKDYSPDDFDSAMAGSGAFDMDSLKVVADSVRDGRRYVQVMARVAPDHSSWTFNLVWEDGHWRVLLQDFSINVPSAK